MPNASKVLLVYVHPEPRQSVANKALLSAVKGLENITIHDLYATYPDFFIDIRHEQSLLCQHQVIVFQFPLQTYSCPALLKEWQDRVLTRPFANKSEKAQLNGKAFRCVITTGEPEHAYQHNGKNHYTLSELLRPLELMAEMCGMRWLSPMIIYSARQQTKITLNHIGEAYADWLSAPLEGESL